MADNPNLDACFKPNENLNSTHENLLTKPVSQQSFHKISSQQVAVGLNLIVTTLTINEKRPYFSERSHCNMKICAISTTTASSLGVPSHQGRKIVFQLAGVICQKRWARSESHVRIQHDGCVECTLQLHRRKPQSQLKAPLDLHGDLHQ